MHTVWNRGARLTWSRRGVAASMVVLVGVGAWAAAGALGDGGPFDETTEPAAPNPLASLCDEFEQQPELSIFLRDDITTAELESLSASLPELPGVAEVTYVSKRGAFRRFKERYRNQPEFYETLPRDALPAVFEVRADDSDRVEEIAAAVENEPGVDDVRYGGEIVENLCNDPDYQELLEIFCRDPAFLDEEDLARVDELCDLLQSPEP